MDQGRKSRLVAEAGETQQQISVRKHHDIPEFPQRVESGHVALVFFGCANKMKKRNEKAMVGRAKGRAIRVEAGRRPGQDGGHDTLAEGNPGSG